MKVSRYFTGIAASFVLFAFMRDGTLERFIGNVSSGARTLSRGGGRIVKKGLS